MTIAVFKPLIEGSISNAVGSWLANIATDFFRNKQEERAALKAGLTAMLEVYFLTFIQSLRVQGYEDEQIIALLGEYREPLEKWLRDQQVTYELLRPFVEVTAPKKLNAVLLQERWKALNIQELSKDWDMDFVCKAYLKRITQEQVVTPELRDLFRTQLQYQSTQALLAIRGVWHDFDVDQYAERLKKKYHVLDLSATVTSRDDNDVIPLKAIFIPQSVKKGHPQRELPKELWTSDVNDVENKQDLQLWRDSQPEAVLPVIGKERLLVVLGDPGAGKSTLARYVLLSVLEPPPVEWVDGVDGVDGVDEAGEPIKTREISWLDEFRERLPFLVELRNYLGQLTDKNCNCFLSYLHHLGRSEGYALNHQEVQQHLHSRPSLFIFDGLDEIFDPRQRATMIEQIIGFATDYPKARVIVTSRIIGYEGHNLRHAGFVEYTLQDLDETQIFTFARGWFNLVFKDRPEEIEFRQQRVERAVTESRAIRQLAGNPLLLTMIAMIAKHQELPRDRAKLYDNAARVLCHQWDVTRHQLKYEHKTVSLELNEEDKLALLRQLAWRMQSSSKGLAGNFITDEALETTVVQYLQGERFGLPQPDALSFGRAVIAQLRERNFILCLYGANVYGFVHRTFLEYFCAVYQVHRFEKTQELSFEQLKVFFKQCAEDGVWHEVLRLICGMIDSKFACELVEILLLIQNSDSDRLNNLEFAQSCLNEIAPSSAREQTSQHLFEAWTQFATDSQENQLVRGSAVYVLASNYKENSEILPWLKQLATNSQEHGWVRRSAVYALAQNYKENSEVLPLLKQLATDSQESQWVRSSAVYALAQYYKEDSETLPLLKQLVTDAQENQWVGGAAVEALARYYKEDSEVLPWLKQLATNSQENEWVRNAAVEAFRFYKNNPDVYVWLQQFLPSAPFSLQSKAVFSWELGEKDSMIVREIDDTRVQQAATALNLSEETVRRCYEHLVTEVYKGCFKLSWLTEQSAD